MYRINVLYKDNKNLNERWDTSIRAFYEQFLNGNSFAIEGISLTNNVKNMISEQEINVGK